MLRKYLALSMVVVSLLASAEVFAQRGGRGGGGGGRSAGGGGGSRGGGGQPGRGGGGEPGRGGGGPQHSAPPQHNSGGFGGGIPPGNTSGGAHHEGAASGPHGGAAGGPDSGVGFRPGAGAGKPGVPGGTTRPGTTPGGVAGGPASGIGVRPGAGTGKPGVPGTPANVRPGTTPGGAVGGPASGIGYRPGAGAGPAGVPAAGAVAATGTRYTSASSLNAQGTAVRAAAVSNPTYNTTSINAYNNAWHPTNLAAASLYHNPGYGAVAAGVGLAAKPVSYDYGGNVVAQPTAVYVNGDPAGTPQQYADQAATIAAAPIQPPASSQWIPLGVFALVEGDATSSDDIFQLAVSPEGAIKGNYHNISTDQMDAITGSVDKTTQRAAWTIGNDKTPVYEAGIANLTKDATPILIHLDNGQTRQLTLIRLPQPAQ